MAEPCLFKNKLCQKKSRGSFLLSRFELILPGTYKNHLFFGTLTGAVIGTGAGAGGDSVWEQKKLEARKLLENGAESPASNAPKKIARNHFIREKRGRNAAASESIL